ncbi:MAG: hypothetical protein U9P12_04435 [Verrucomicrobiota bacterium]|nr:hypothetical protein [Verrucomicrobiota bacterium]
MKTEFHDIDTAFDFVSYGRPGEHSAILDKGSGKIYYESVFGDSDGVPDEVLDSGNTVEIPRKNLLDLGQRLVFRFVGEFMPDDFGRVETIFSRRSAYAYYKDLLEEREMLDSWHAYEKAATQKAIREWCADEGIELLD